MAASGMMRATTIFPKNYAHPASLKLTALHYWPLEVVFHSQIILHGVRAIVVPKHAFWCRQLKKKLELVSISN